MTKLNLICIDGWDRPVFKDMKNDLYYKSILLAPSDFRLFNSKIPAYLENLYDTDDPDGEPCLPVDGSQFVIDPIEIEEGVY